MCFLAEHENGRAQYKLEILPLNYFANVQMFRHYISVNVNFLILKLNFALNALQC